MQDRLFYIIGQNEVIPVPNLSIGNDNVLTIRSYGSDFEFIPEMRRLSRRIDIYPHLQIKRDGNFTLLNGEDPVRGISFNYDRAESAMRFYTRNELDQIIDNQNLYTTKIVESSGKPFVQTLSELNMGIKLWRWFVLLALLFLLAESLLLRFYK
jgi:hypothetical protein